MKNCGVYYWSFSPVSNHTNTLNQDLLAPGTMIYVDRYQNKTPVRIPNTCHQGKKHIQYNGGTIYVDHATSLIFIFTQVSLSSGKILVVKKSFEIFARNYGITIKHIHGDNGAFKSREFKEPCESKGRTHYFSGPGAHHHNAVSEQSIHTVAYWVRATVIRQHSIGQISKPNNNLHSYCNIPHGFTSGYQIDSQDTHL